MADQDISYFERRAEAELELAQRARHPDAVKAHYHLAGFYLDRVYSGRDVIDHTLNVSEPVLEMPGSGRLSQPSA